MTKKQKYYVVWNGVQPGIYNNWKDCQLQIKNFPNAEYKSFKTREEAELAFEEGMYADYIKQKTKPKSGQSFDKFQHQIIKDSISVDASCLGNPGIMEYRGVLTYDGFELFRKGPFQQSTNNIGEFLGLVHGLAYLKKNNMHQTVIYTDSKTAMKWIENKKVKTLLKRTPQNADSFELLGRALNWIKVNSWENKILKWQTDQWGEIPADFGRK